MWSKKLVSHQVNFQEAKLYLIFEFLTMDLKKYMDGAVSRHELNRSLVYFPQKLYLFERHQYFLFLCRQGHMDATLIKSYTYQLFQVTNPLMMLDLLLILIAQRRLLC